MWSLLGGFSEYLYDIYIYIIANLSLHFILCYKLHQNIVYKSLLASSTLPCYGIGSLDQGIWLLSRAHT